ncbi:MAG: pilus assembly protein [Armatimonadetes bacterium]|nr:pilus assembly protein [Armatimonadota bacterium]
MNTWRMNNRGVALVEFALIALLFITLAIGIIDFGLLAKDYLTLGSAAREGARAAALGGAKEEVIAAVRASAPTPNSTENPKVYMWYAEMGANPDWRAYSSPDEIPPELADVQVKVRAEYECNRISGTFFGEDPITLSADEVMRKE